MRIILWIAAPVGYVIGAVVFLALALLMAGAASAHSWYDWDCCTDKDCAPVADGAISESADGYHLPDGEIVPYGSSKIRLSPDAHFHWCHSQQMTYCVYIPGRGV